MKKETEFLQELGSFAAIPEPSQTSQEEASYFGFCSYCEKICPLEECRTIVDMHVDDYGHACPGTGCNPLTEMDKCFGGGNSHFARVNMHSKTWIPHSTDLYGTLCPLSGEPHD